MKDTSEVLRETLLNLEEARKKESLQKKIAEALLAGLRVVVLTEDTHLMFEKLFEVMNEALDAEAAFVLSADEDYEDEGFLRIEAASDDKFINLRWQAGALMKRVLDGDVVAVFDVSSVPEWIDQHANFQDEIRSALLFSISAVEKKAVFVGAHSKRGHFSREHLNLARRFSILATQALLKLETEKKVAELQKKLETEAKLAELNRKLRESERRLDRAKRMEALGLLTGGVAHDLNNILSGIVGYPELLLMDDCLSNSHRKALKAIRDSGLRASAVVSDMLTLTRGVAGKKEAANLNDIVEEYLVSPEHAKLLESHKGLRVQRYLSKNLKNINASVIHVRKALMNLVSNAAEALEDSSDGVIRISTENIHLVDTLKGFDSALPGEYAVLKVSDNGPGIDDERLERIFEPFYAKKNLGRSGTGLGLTIVWNAMKDHKGYIDVKSSPEKGTVFILYFPITRCKIEKRNEEFSVSEIRGEGEKILVVDDIKQQREMAKALLTSLNYEVVLEPDGEKAVEFLKNNKVDLVVLDMIMEPGMNGKETYKRIIEIHPGQKAIIVSGYSPTQEVKEAQKLGAGEYVKKPYTLETLGRAVKAEIKK